MRASMIIVGLFLACQGHAAPVPSPRAELKAAVEQLQKTPDDAALRERIIQLANQVKPAPALPEEAERRMARGAAAFKGAKSAADYLDAAREYEQATLAAPWFGDAYFDLGVAQDKAGNYEGALRSLKLAQAASRDAKAVKALIYEVEYRRDKNLDAEKKKRAFDLSGIYRQERGTHWIGRPDVDYYDEYHYQIKIQGTNVVITQITDISVDTPVGTRYKIYEGSVEGRELVVKNQYQPDHTNHFRVSEDCNAVELYKITLPDGSEWNRNYAKPKWIRVSQ